MVPAVDLDDKKVLCFKRESPKSDLYIIEFLANSDPKKL
jgi:hypothetical protein